MEPKTVTDVLTSRVHPGEIRFRDIVTSDAHTAVIIAHRLSTVMNADLVVVLQEETVVWLCRVLTGVS